MQTQERDPCARQEIERESAGPGECDWCGSRRRIVWTYAVATDGGRRFEVPGRFCGKGCRDAYHGR